LWCGADYLEMRLRFPDLVGGRGLHVLGWTSRKSQPWNGACNADVDFNDNIKSIPPRTMQDGEKSLFLQRSWSRRGKTSAQLMRTSSVATVRTGCVPITLTINFMHVDGDLKDWGTAKPNIYFCDSGAEGCSQPPQSSMLGFTPHRSPKKTYTGEQEQPAN
jgi:hypothetical protein